MKTYEKTDSTRWIDRLLNRWPFCLDTDSIRSIGIAWLFKEDGQWCFTPRITGNVALFYNAVLFLRLSLPFGIFWSIRWAEVGPVLFGDVRSYLQGSLGWKLNGRFTAGPLLFALRLQGDKASAAGVSGPNYGQAQGFDYGTH